MAWLGERGVGRGGEVRDGLRGHSEDQIAEVVVASAVL